MRNLPLILAAIIMPSCAAILIVALMGLSASRADLNEVMMTKAYACAYVAGQYAIMNRMPSVFQGTKTAPSYCDPFKSLAARNGFQSDAE